ncbi:MAG: 2-phosphosulfolactate phosphatase [Bacillaceae bacterium]|nr:2-phosphosulfolactate phosphatase [Bacillaceae bacterium]
MKVDVVPRLDELRTCDLINKTVIIMDVLRSSSTIVTALSLGYKQVIPVDTIGQAHQLHSGDTYLAGERYGKKIQGFHFSNSPHELISHTDVRPTLVLTTTNGTKAIRKAQKGEKVLIGCLMNGSICAQQAFHFQKDITLVCAGSRQQFALEDGMAAGMIISKLKQLHSSICVDDLGIALEACFRQNRGRLTAALTESATGQRLIRMGLEQDVAICAQLDSQQLVPFVQNERIIAICP